MQSSLLTLLRHRGVPHDPVVHQTGRDYTVYVLGTELRVVCFQRLVKKSDIAALVAQGLRGLQVLVTVPGISRPAAVFAAEQSVHVLTEDMYALDRLQSRLVPSYTLLTEDEVHQLETRHCCPRTHWPTLPSLDPVALYLGLQPGMSVRIRTRAGLVNLRHVRSTPY